MSKYTEIFKLKKMLEEADIPFVFDDFSFEHPFTKQKGYQIIINLDGDDRVDAVQHYASYGERHDLLEIMGGLTKKECRTNGVLGYLTAEEVFKRFKYCYKNKTSVYLKR